MRRYREYGERVRARVAVARSGQLAREVLAHMTAEAAA
jgi:hypothetical protein